MTTALAESPSSSGEVTLDDITWTPFTEPIDWFAGVDPDDDHTAIIARLLLMRRADAEVMSATLERLHEQHKELERQYRVIVRLNEERRAGMKEIADVDEHVNLKNGPVVKLDAVRLANELEALGVELEVDEGGKLWPAPPVSKDSHWGKQILEHRDDLVAIVRYCAELPR